MLAWLDQLIDNVRSAIYGESPWVWMLTLLGISIIVGLVVRWMFIRFLRISYRRQGSLLAGAVLKQLSNRTRVFFPLLIFFLCQPLIYLDEPYDEIVFKTTEILFFITVGWLLLKLINALEDLAFAYYAEEKHNPFRERKIKTQLQFMKRLLTVLIFLIVIASILLTFEEVRQAGAAILTSAGVAGIVIGVAAQKSLANLVAGLQIAITQPIKIDDAVIVENEWGVIEEITLTYVVVRVWDKRRIVLPITYFIETPFQNWTRNSADLTGVIMLYVDYSLSVDALRTALHDILQGEELWDGQAETIQVVDTTERTMVLRVLVSAPDAATTFTLRCSVREKLISFIQQQHPEALPKNRLIVHESRGVEAATNGSKETSRRI